MKKTTYQVPEIRDENDNIVQEGTFGKKTAFVNSTNSGVLDYLFNNLEALHDIVEVELPIEAETPTGATT